MENKYVLQHEFGYEIGVNFPINKLKLRDIEDLKCYLNDVIKTDFLSLEDVEIIVEIS